MVSWDEYARIVPAYAEQVSLPADAADFVAQLRSWLESIARSTDQSCPDNAGVRIENGELVLTKVPRKDDPAELRWLEKTIADRLEPVQILDAPADRESAELDEVFRPALRPRAKIDKPRERYVVAAFCYGCDLGPSQTARSLKDSDRRQIAWVSQRHITEEKLDHAITTIINAYNQFNIPKLWVRKACLGRWNEVGPLRAEFNLLSEYHIGYGGYGGIGYYHVSDMYIALFSHFIPCGVWEAVHILDGLLKNKSDIQPDTLHADTQGQNAPVFGLAHLLGIAHPELEGPHAVPTGQIESL